MKQLCNTYSCRFTKKQKKQFALKLCEKYEALGYATQIMQNKSRMSHVMNVMVGNFKNAKTIIVVPYDTPAKMMWFKSPMFVQNGDYQMKKNFIPTYAPLFLSYLVLLFLIYGLPSFMGMGNTWWLSLIAAFYLVALVYLIFKGMPNKHNAVRNSASLILAYDLASSLEERRRKEVAFVFTDKNALRVKGGVLLENYMRALKKKTDKIVLYCIGRGDRISIGYKKGMRKCAGDLQKKHHGETKVYTTSMNDGACMQLPLEPLSDAVMISSGVLKEDKLHVNDTANGKDRTYDEGMVEEVKEMLLAYLASK